MKKLLIGLFLLAGAFTFAACNSVNTDAIEENVTFESNDQVFALEALSAASLLDYSNIEVVSYVPLSEVTTEATTEETTTGEDIIVDDKIDEIDQYLEMMENLLGDNNGLSVEALVSDKAEWEKLISFTTVNVLGDEIVYYMYYNETLFVSEDDTITTEIPTTEEPTTEVPTTEVPTTEVPTTEAPTTEVPTTETTELAYTLSNGDQERNFFFEDDDDNEVVYLLTGLVVSNGIEYNVEGKRIVEDNGDEVLRLRSFIDRDNYVKVSYKLDAEDSKEKFFFEVVTDGVLVTSSKVKVMEKDGNLKVFLDIVSNGDKAKYVFKIIEEDGATFYHIKYDIILADGTTESGNIHIIATIDEATGDVIYTYKILDSENKVKNQYKTKYQVEKRHENRSHRGEHSNNKGNL